MSRTPAQAVHQPTVGWFELFYDLVIVAAVGYSSHEFIADPTWAMGGWIAASLLVMFVLWLLTSLGSNLYPGDHPLRRLLGLVQMLALVVAALSSGRDGGLPDSTGFVALAAAFASVAGIYAIGARSGQPGAGDARPIIVSSALGALVLLVGAFVPPAEGQGWGAGAWILGIGVAVAAVPLIGPFLGRLCRQGRIDDEHLGERVGQLVIIVLGESFVSLVAALSDEPDIPNPLFLVLTFAVVFAIWTLYFSSVMPAGVPRAAGSLRGWLAGHWLLMFGAVGAAGGFSALAVVPFDADQPGSASAWTTVPLVWVVLALALLTWLGRGRMTVLVLIHLAAAAVLLALAVLSVTITTGGSAWEVALGSLVVIADAVICARLERPYAVSRAAVDTPPAGTGPSPS